VGKARVISGATLTQIFDVTGTYNLQALGKSVANLGDLDGDGLADFAVGAPMSGPTVPGATPPPPQVQVWSSGTASLLYTITSGSGGFASSNFGVAAATAGDVGSSVGGVYAPTPDGVPDILVGASVGNAAAVYSGADGAFLYVMDATTINSGPMPPLLLGNDDFGGTVAGAADVSGDGIPDFLVCAVRSALGGVVVVSPNTYYAGAVFLMSGAGGGVLHVFIGAPGDSVGQSAAFVGDVDGDFVADIAVGATRTDVSATDAGSVTVYSGATFLPLWSAHGLLANEGFGYALAPAGDVTGDGRPDVLAGTPTTDVGASNSGSATLLDGVTGARLGTIDGLAASDLLGRAVSGYGDFDADGTPEVLVAAPSADVGGSSTGSVSVVSFGPYLRPCAAGSIPAPGGGTFDMITINGSAGGPPRRVDLSPFQAFTIAFTQPPSLASPAPLYTFGLLGAPLASDELALAVLGTLCFLPPVLSPGDPRLFLLADSFATFNPGALAPMAPPGSWSIPVPTGLPAPFRAALTGVTFDGGYYRTNTVLVDVR
jgi:hypothetical protein